MSLSIGIGATDPELVGPGREFNWRGMQGADPHSQPGPNIPRMEPYAVQRWALQTAFSVSRWTHRTYAAW